MPAPKGNKYAEGNPGGGADTKYKPEYANIAKKLCLLGSTDKGMAEAFDVCEKTINTWKVKHKEFATALKEGKVFADADVAKSLYERALGYSHAEDKIFNNGLDKEPTIVRTTKHYPPDSTACLFWLKNRQPDVWREKAEDTTGEYNADDEFK